MKTKRPSYRNGKEFTAKGKRKIIERAIKEATSRTEAIVLRTRKSPLQISEEMRVTAMEKMKFYSSHQEKWVDRNSIITAPFGADLYMISDRGVGEVLMGAPRYFFHEFRDPYNYPDARERFPYDREAILAAKKITRLLRWNVVRKKAAAVAIQAAYRGYAVRKYLARRLSEERYEEEVTRRASNEFHLSTMEKWSSVVYAKKTAKVIKQNIQSSSSKVFSVRQEQRIKNRYDSKNEIWSTRICSLIRIPLEFSFVCLLERYQTKLYVLSLL